MAEVIISLYDGCSGSFLAAPVVDFFGGIFDYNKRDESVFTLKREREVSLYKRSLWDFVDWLIDWWVAVEIEEKKSGCVLVWWLNDDGGGARCAGNLSTTHLGGAPPPAESWIKTKHTNHKPTNHIRVSWPHKYYISQYNSKSNQ